MESRTPTFQGGHLLLEVYIAGYTPAAKRAISNLKELCADLCQDGAFEINVIDIIENPQAAEVNSILATPTVIRRSPPPLGRIIGDLSVWDEAVLGLKLLNA